MPASTQEIPKATGSVTSVENLTRGLVALWSGNGNGHDSVGTNNAILTEMAYAEGKVGKAFSLDGHSSHAKIPASPVLDMENTAGFTISAWIKPTDVSGFHPIL